MSISEKQKQVYYVFSALEGNERFDKTSFTLAVDYFINNKNAYACLNDISAALTQSGIAITPEALYESLSSVRFEGVFDSFPLEENITTPFRISNKVYEDFINTTDSIERLNQIVHQYVLQHGYKQYIEPLIIDVLLETIFSRNIQFLKSIVSKKEETNLSDLIVHEGNLVGDYDECVYSAYNGLLLESNNSFDEVLRVLILRMFDFLALYYNPDYEKALNKKYSGKCFYLDSSFIVRLLGFDGSFRTERARELLSILKGVDSIQFAVHTKTIEEAQKKIKELIDKNVNILSKGVKAMSAISRRTGKQDPMFELFAMMIKDGEVVNYHDFRLFFSDIKKNLLKHIPTLTIDSKSLYSTSSDRESLYSELQKTDKTAGRIKHIIKLLDYIDKLRGGNNYNPLEVKYWLLTTDKKTLDIDSRFIDENPDHGKSICIMPSEIIRQINYCSGNIKGNHLEVFKKYMLKTKAYAQQYSEDEVETVSKIATFVERADLEKYDVDKMIDNLFSQYSLNEIQNRLSAIATQREKDQELVDLFTEANANYIDTKFSRAVNEVSRKANKWGHFWICLILYTIPVTLTVYVMTKLVIFKNIQWDPATWINADSWSSLEGVFTIIDFFFWGITIFLDTKLRAKFVNWYSTWRTELFLKKLQ